MLSTEMRLNERSDSERSDETCSSQETTCTSVSENLDSSQASEHIISVDEQGCSRIKPASIGRTTPVSCKEHDNLFGNVVNREETNDDNLNQLVLPSEKPSKQIEETSIDGAKPISCKKHNNLFGNVANRDDNLDHIIPASELPNEQVEERIAAFTQRTGNESRIQAGRLSRELKPLLEQESLSSANSEPVLQDFKDTNGDDVPIPHAKTYPDNINKDAERDTFCDCGQTKLPESKKGDCSTKNDLKLIIENYNGLKGSYQKVWRIFLALAALDTFLIVCMVTVVPSVAITTVPLTWTTISPGNGPPANYNICFDCTDLELDREFSAETLRGVHRTSERCCFDSITSVYFSFKQIFRNHIDDRVNSLNFSLTYLQAVISSGEGGKRNFSTEYIIQRLLMLSGQKEKTVVHLLSAEGPPTRDQTMSGVFYKVSWDQGGDGLILRGKAKVWDSQHLQVEAEGFYFLYARLRFKTNPGFKPVTFKFNINRQRGSTSTYIYEARESFLSTDTSQEYSCFAEILVHLIRFDEIFISVSKSDIGYLATEPEAHMMGLFEL